MIESKTKVVIEGKDTAFGDIPVGDVFRYSNCLYLKIRSQCDAINAFRINGRGELSTFSDCDTLVRHIPVTITFHE